MRAGEPLRALVAAIAVLGAATARAQAPPADPTEATDLRVTRPIAGIVRLDWQPPVAVPDTYQVRRCLLASLRVPYYGNCVAQGLVTTTWEEPLPEGDVFYLVQGTTAGVEGSIGKSFNGHLWRERVVPTCGEPVLPATLTLRVHVREPVDLCGVQVLLTFDDALVQYVAGSAACAGIASSWLGVTNDSFPGEIRQACVAATPATGPGYVVQMQFDRGDCPLPASTFDLVSCAVNACDGSSLPATCELR